MKDRPTTIVEPIIYTLHSTQIYSHELLDYPHHPITINTHKTPNRLPH